MHACPNICIARSPIISLVSVWFVNPVGAQVPSLEVVMCPLKKVGSASRQQACHLAAYKLDKRGEREEDMKSKGQGRRKE